MKIKMRVATQSLISAQVANGGGAPVVELLLCQQSGFCRENVPCDAKLPAYSYLSVHRTFIFYKKQKVESLRGYDY